MEIVFLQSFSEYIFNKYTKPEKTGYSQETKYF